MSFVCGVGKSNLDILYSGITALPKEGQEVYAKKLDVQMGGGIPATMINLSSLGVPVKLFTMLGTDFFSNIVQYKLIERKVDYRNLYNGDGMPLCVTSAMITDIDRTFISFEDKIIIDDDMINKVYNDCKDTKIIQMQVGFLEVYKKLKKHNSDIIFVFDTGWEEDLSIAKYQEYIELADYYTPSKDEALKVTNTNTVEESILVLDKYFDKVIIKLDKDGCLVRVNNQNFIVPPMQNITKVDSTGAGDAFLSGLMYGLFCDYDFLDCIIFGNICGGFCVQEIGCLGKFPSVSELKENFDIIKRNVIVQDQK